MPGMALILLIVGIAFESTCLWLSVRIFNKREPFTQLALAIAIGLPVAYILAEGPLGWVIYHQIAPESIETLIDTIFTQPIGLAFEAAPEEIQIAYCWYLSLWFPVK
jgi:hypothetical protein